MVQDSKSFDASWENMKDALEPEAVVATSLCLCLPVQRGKVGRLLQRNFKALFNKY
jgi:hypothetical protein